MVHQIWRKGNTHLGSCSEFCQMSQALKLWEPLSVYPVHIKKSCAHIQHSFENMEISHRSFFLVSLAFFNTSFCESALPENCLRSEIN